METLHAENVVRVSGEIEDHNLQPLQQAVMTILQGTQAEPALDLSAVPTLPAEAMAMLQQASAVLKERGRRLMVITSHRPRTNLLDFELIQLCLNYDPRRGHCAHGPKPKDTEAVETVVGSKAW